MPNLGSEKSTVKSSNSGKSDKSKALLWAFVPPNDVVGIKLDYQMPQSFVSDEECLQWKKKTKQDAEELKEKLELGFITLDSVKERVVVFPPGTPQPKGVVNCIFDKLFDDEQMFFAERDFIRLSKELRECLSYEPSHVDRCLEILKEYQKIECKMLMLLRNHDCVDMIRRLRNYVGNVQAWNMSAQEESDFNIKAAMIQHEAALVYNSFKKLFGIKEKQGFWEMFCNQVDAYFKYTEHISQVTQPMF